MKAQDPIVYTFSIMNERWERFCNHPIMQENDTRTVAAGQNPELLTAGRMDGQGRPEQIFGLVPTNRMRVWKVQPFHVILTRQLIKASS